MTYHGPFKLENSIIKIVNTFDLDRKDVCYERGSTEEQKKINL